MLLTSFRGKKKRALVYICINVLQLKEGEKQKKQKNRKLYLNKHYSQ